MKKDYKKTILVIATMEGIELNYLKNKLNNRKTIEEKVCTFIEGEMEEKHIVLCNAKIGMINATMATTLGIEKYSPMAIINEGTAGGYREDIHSGDIIIGTECINIMSHETKKREKGQGININDYEITTFLQGEKNHIIKGKADIGLLEKAQNVACNFENIKVHFGILGSGDVWNKEVDKIIYLNNKYEILSEDMESVAVYTVANLYDIPVIGIRAISNNELLDEEFNKNTGINAQKFTEKLINNI